MFAEGVFSSLVTRLTLAVLAVLVLSLGVTTAVFAGQSQVNNRNAAFRTLRQQQNTLAVRTRVCNALLNTTTRTLLERPLAKVGTLRSTGIDRVLLTSWPDDAVVGDTANGGGPLPNTRFKIAAGAPGPGERPFDGSDYAYLALPGVPNLLRCDPPNPPANAPSYRNIILLVHLETLSQLTWDVVTKLAVPGAIAIIISTLAALLVLRAMTRPLHDMTLASESMAAGNYDQQVEGDASAGEIGQLARAFNRMAHEVKRAREMQRQFVANVSHDLRSPLTSIIGFSQALTEDDAITPRQRHIAEIISSDAERLQRLTMDLLDLSRLEAGRLPLSKRPLDLNNVLRDIATRYEALPSPRGCAFSAQLCAEPLPVFGDPDRLTQIVVNLVDNGLKFCNPRGEVRLTSSRRGGVAVVEVYNTGAGIAPDDLPRVFDRFYRGDHSRALQTGGSGIGLAIVRELVYAHGGEVAASSRLGAWTAMTVRLPLAAQTQFTEDLHLANTGATRIKV